jgi:molybdenum cofactor biosynthesis protein B
MPRRDIRDCRRRSSSYAPRSPALRLSPDGRYTLRVSLVEHRRDAPASVRCFVLTISDTRSADNDPSGDAIAQALESAGHEIAGRALVRDDPGAVRDTIRATAPDVDAIVATGGTGITARDSTYEAVASLLQKRLDGFGELFRMLSYEQIGAAAMLSRACAGTIGTTVVFSLPGSTKAVSLALEKLILPELPHIVRELRR